MTDFVPNNTSTTFTLSGNATITGTIDSGGDQDWYRVNLTGNRSYQIDLEGSPTSAGTLSDPYIRGIHDAAGTLIDLTRNDDGGTGLNSRLEFIPATTGTYYIAAGAFGSNTGTFTLRISDLGIGDDYGDTTASAGSISVGNSVSGEIEDSGDRDWFQVSLQAGFTYQIDLQGAPTSAGTLSDPYFRGVHDSSGELISGTLNDDSGSGLNSQLEFSATTSGTYYLAAGAFGSNTGTYTLSITSTGSTDDFGEDNNLAGSVSVDGSAAGTIEEAGDRDWFGVDLIGGRSYQIDLEGAPTNAGSLRDPFLRGIHEVTGIAIGSAVTELIGGTANDDGGSGLNSQLEFTAPGSGRFYISAGAYGSNTGSYRLTVTDLGAQDDYGETVESAGLVSVGGAATGEIEQAGDVDWFSLTLQAGRNYRIDLEGAPTNGGDLADPLLQGLYDSSGGFIAGTSNDDGGDGFNSALEISTSGAGTIYIAAAAYGSNTGSYTVSVTDLGSPDDYGVTVAAAGSVSVGGSATGEIEEAGDQDWFGVSLQAGQTYQIDLEGSPTSRGSLSDTFLRGIYDSSGSLISGTANDDGGASYNSQLEFSPASSGNYYIAAGGFGNNVGSYTLSVAQLGVADDYGDSATTAGALSVGGAVTGVVEEAGDRDWFAVSLQAGAMYEINLEGSPTDNGTLSDTYLRGIYDSNGSLLSGTSNDDGGTGTNSLLEFVPASSGTFYIAAGAYGSNTGSYKLPVEGEVASGDDYGETAGSAGSVSVNGASSGNIEIPGDRDWFAVSLQGGSSYQISLEGSATNNGTLSDPFLRGVYNSSGSLISGSSNDDGGQGRNSFLEFNPASSGTYYIAAGAFASNIGTYKLSISGEQSSGDDFGETVGDAGTLLLNTAKSGVIEVAEDRDWFAIQLQGGDNYRFDLEGSPTGAGSLSDTYLRGIYDASGNLLSGSSDDDGGTATNSRVDFVAPASGTYYVAAGSYGSSTGSYTLTAAGLGTGGSSGGSGGGADSSFDIAINFDGDVSYLSYFENAIVRWRQIITGELPDIESSQYGYVDDLLIEAAVTAIDGPGGILGQAGADSIRTGSLLPFHGRMAFDVADMRTMEDKGILQEVILHEMGHVLGFSSWFFERLGLANGTVYTGTNGLEAYRTLLGDNSVSFVPLEDDGGQGTALSHFEEDIFNTELMTGYAENNPPMPLSRLTVGVFEDLGYEVSYAFADFLPNPNALSASLSLPLEDSLILVLDSPRAGLSNTYAEAVIASPAQSDASSVAALDIPANFSGSRFYYTDAKPLQLDGSLASEKLRGGLSVASETQISFIETNTGAALRVVLDGEFEKNDPVTLDDLKGAVTRIAFNAFYSPEPLSELVYDQPRDVQQVLADWHGDFLAGDNVIEVAGTVAYDDVVAAGAGDDLVALGAGSDSLDGGPGLDTAVFARTLSEYSLINDAGVLQLSSVDGSDSLSNVERLQFADQALAFDLDGKAGQLVKMIGVLLGPSALAQTDLIGAGLQILDANDFSFEQIMALGIEVVLGAPSNEQLFTHLYTNVAGTAPGAALIAEFVPLLDNGTYSQTSLGVAAAEFELNLSNINLVGLEQSGVAYLAIA